MLSALTNWLEKWAERRHLPLPPLFHLSCPWGILTTSNKTSIATQQLINSSLTHSLKSALCFSLTPIFQIVFLSLNIFLTS